MDKCYRIANWDDNFETSDTRKLIHMKWVPIPNKHDGLGFRRIALHKDNVQLFCAWNLMVQVASRGGRGERGWLTRDKKPLTADDLSIMTGFPAEIFEMAFEFFSSPAMGWLSSADPDEAQEVSGGNPEVSGDFPEVSGDSPGRIEGNRIEGNRSTPKPPAGAFAREGELPLETPTRERKPKATHPQADSIYELYPKKIDPEAAKKAITKAIERGAAPEHLRRRTALFAEVVKGCDRQYIPYPATWFNAGGYDSDPAEWGTIGRDSRPPDPPGAKPRNFIPGSGNI